MNKGNVCYEIKIAIFIAWSCDKIKSHTYRHFEGFFCGKWWRNAFGAQNDVSTSLFVEYWLKINTRDLLFQFHLKMNDMSDVDLLFRMDTANMYNAII